jgi:hypothetical protein
MLGETFRNHLKNILPATHFDFHSYVKGDKYDNLSYLLDNLQKDVNAFSFFLYNFRTKTIQSEQNGIFRVNCVDCLDRTNVVQGLICRSSISKFCATLKTSSENMFAQCLNDMWADNGDALSIIYTGTGALKSGFTRTGKRTLLGIMDDAKKSAARFYMNNFQDKYKQEVMDLLLGKLANQKEIRLFNPVKEMVDFELHQRKVEYSSSRKIRVHVATWNVNGKQPSENLLPWLTFPKSGMVDMIVVGFQEIVELSPQQIMATDNQKLVIWESILLDTINKVGGKEFVALKSGQLVGAALCIFIRKEFAPNVRNVHGTIKKTGLAGLAGNKGGIAIRMDFFDTSLCFVCAHLAAGHSNIEDRNTDYFTISEGLSFIKGRKIADHDAIVWLGDFNYRIETSYEEALVRISHGDYDYLKARDQLINQMKENKVFVGFTEAPISFGPTYKFDNGTNTYDTSEKRRVPAYTDRILFKGNNIEILEYARAELQSSDHRPVKAMLNCDLQILDKKKMEAIQQSLYLKFTKSDSDVRGKKVDNKSKQIVKEANLIDFDDIVPVSASPMIKANNNPFNQIFTFGQQQNYSSTPSYKEVPLTASSTISDPFSDIARSSSSLFPVHLKSQKQPPPLPSRNENPFGDNVGDLKLLK